MLFGKPWKITKKSDEAESVHRPIGFNMKRYNLHEIFYSSPKILYIKKKNFNLRGILHSHILEP